MHKIVITLELEDEKYNAMEIIMINRGCKKNNYKNWEQNVIETYYKAETYLECNNNDLEKAYIDMLYDF